MENWNQRVKERIVLEKVCLKRFLSNKANLAIFFFGAFIPVFYLAWRPAELEKKMIPYTYSPALTQWLQDLLGVDTIVAWAFSWVYMSFHIMSIGLLYFVAYFAERGNEGSRARPAWVYGLPMICFQQLDMLIWLIWPVAPPIRWIPEGSGVVAIRTRWLPWSDDLITYYYSALPSGHASVTIAGFLAAHYSGQKKFRAFFFVEWFLVTFTILYLGEHYWLDPVASILVAGTLICISVRIYDSFRYRDSSSDSQTDFRSPKEPFLHLAYILPLIGLLSFIGLRYAAQITELTIGALFLLLASLEIAIIGSQLIHSHSEQRWPVIVDELLFGEQTANQVKCVQMALGLGFVLIVFPGDVATVAVIVTLLFSAWLPIVDAKFPLWRFPGTQKRTVGAFATSFVGTFLISAILISAYGFYEELSWKVFLASFLTSLAVSLTYLQEKRQRFRHILVNRNLLRPLIVGFVLHVVLAAVPVKIASLLSI
ncbi:MAG: phosphatase PAP2 family protein [Candidatus Thorarchaeota archaeon]